MIPNSRAAFFSLALSLVPAGHSFAKEIQFGLTRINQDLHRNYRQGIRALELEFRKGLGRDIAAADEIHLVRVSKNYEEFSSEAQPGSDYFIVMPYSKEVKILAKKKLTPDEQKEFTTLLTKSLENPDDSGGGAFCHEPEYAVYVIKDSEVIFSTSFSWSCGNLWLLYPDIEPRFFGSDLPGLKEFCEKALPPK